MVGALTSLVRKYSPEILFLSETKSNQSEIRRVQDKLGFDKSLCVEARGRAGGLALFWVKEVEVMERKVEDHFMDVFVRSDGGRKWRLTGLYGWSESGQKYRTWEMINSLGNGCSLPWVIGGDFNEVLFSSEKRGGNVCDSNNMAAFHDCLDKNGLKDIDSLGHPFTWNNRRTEGYIEEKLDRCVSNDTWGSLFPGAFVDIITWDGSDHSPLS